MSGRHPPLTIHRRLAHGAVLRHGRSAPYRAIEIGAGEPHLVRDDFGCRARDAEAEPAVPAGRCSAWFTSPTCSSPTSSRRRGSSSSTPASPTPGTPRSSRCSVRRRRSPRTPSTPPSARSVRCTARRPGCRRSWRSPPATRSTTRSGTSCRPSWPCSTAAWCPRIPAAPATRECRRRTGRATSSGGRTGRAPTGPTSSAASSATRTIPACCDARCASSPPAGLSIPWLSCFGNHEALNQGVGTQTPGPRRPR